MAKNSEYGRLITFPDIGNWRVSVDGKDAYNIYPDTPEHPVYGDRKARLVKLGKKTFLIYDDSDGKEQEVEWNLADIKNAVRFAYMQNQKPITEGRVDFLQSLVDTGIMDVGKTVVYPDIDNWSAYRKLENIIRIMDNNKVIKGSLIYGHPTDDEVRLWYDGAPQDWNEYEKWDDFANVKNAVRYLFLKTQKPISE